MPDRPNPEPSRRRLGQPRPCAAPVGLGLRANARGPGLLSCVSKSKPSDRWKMHTERLGGHGFRSYSGIALTLKVTVTNKANPMSCVS